MSRSILPVAAFVSILALGVAVAFGYTIETKVPPLPGNHEKSVIDACSKAKEAKVPCTDHLKNLVVGVREPDDQGVPWQMAGQKLFSKEGSRRDVSWSRVAAQHIHGNPLP